MAEEEEGSQLKMAEEEESSLSLLSLKDFEERGIEIDREWTALDALVAVASVASKKLEGERITKEKQKKPADDQSDEYLRFPARKIFEHGNSPSTSAPRALTARVISYKKQREKALKKPVADDLYSKKGQGFYDKFMGDAIKARIRLPDHFSNDADADWVGGYTKHKKMRRIVSQDCSKPNKNQKIALAEIPDLPQEFKERIQQQNGSKIGLVIHKWLYPTDVDNHQCRLSIPPSQIISKDFLKDDEKRDLDNGGEMQVKLIEPTLQESEMIFKRQLILKNKVCMVKAKSYVLINKWNVVKDRNNLKSNDIIQLWKFRSPAEELCLALVLVDHNGTNVCEDDKKPGDDVAKVNQGTEEDGSSAISDDNAKDRQGTEEDGSNASHDQSPASEGTN